MKRLALFLVLGLLIACAAWAAEKPESAAGPFDRVVIPSPPGETAIKKPVVRFPHARHSSLTCGDCHHGVKGAVSGEDGGVLTDNPLPSCSLSGCHDDPSSKKGDRSWYAAFHDKESGKSCLGCHRRAKAEDGNKVAPASCNQCHAK